MNISLKMKMNPSFREEEQAWKKGIKYVIGIDEVGRGAFAGPIVAAGVIYKPNFKHHFLKNIKDSKRLTFKKREELSILVKKHSAYFVIEKVELDFINKWGIEQANQKVIEKVINKLITVIKKDSYYILVDGRQKENKKQKGIIKGDEKSITIASASIIAKVHRDNLMIKFSDKYPQYKFLNNKGYGTKYHRNAIVKYGICDLHRTSFRLNST